MGNLCGSPQGSYEDKQASSLDRAESFPEGRRSTHSLAAPDVHFEELKTLVTIPFFENLDHKRAKELRALFKRKTYDTDQVVVKQGKKEHTFWVIVSGRVRVTVHERKSSTELEMDVLEKGAWFGEVALVRDRIEPVTVRALEPSTILSISTDQFKTVVDRFPELSVSVCCVGKMAPLNIQLRQVPFFARVDEPKLAVLATLLDVRKCAAGEVICRQGDEGDGLYYLVEGRIDVRADGPDGEEVRVIPQEVEC